jgi:hypothetical protein
MGTMTGCGPASAPPSSIAGTWDVQGSTTGQKPTMATVLLDANHFTFAVTGGDSLTFVSQGGTMTLVWHQSGNAPIVTTHTAAALNQGVFPLPLGGVWSFSAPNSSVPEECQAQIGAPQLTASCLNVVDLPEPLPYTIDGNITGIRQSTLGSIFGDLGGVWHIGDPGNAGAGGCDATVSGNTISVTCNAGGAWNGTASLTFCDGIAVGSTSAGVEFTAVRQ